MRRILHFGTGDVFHRYMEGYSRFIKEGTVSILFSSKDSEAHWQKVGKDSGCAFVPAEEFWQSPTAYGTFQRVIIAVPPQEIVSLAERVINELRCEYIFLEKPAFITEDGLDRLKKLAKHRPDRIRLLSQYLYKPALLRARNDIDLIGKLNSVSFWMLEKNLLNEQTMAAHRAGILRCFICHGLFATKHFLEVPPSVMMCRRGRYKDCPKDVADTFGDLVGFSGEIPVRMAFAKGWSINQKALVLDGTEGRIIAFLKRPFILVDGGMYGPVPLDASDRDDSYFWLVNDIVLKPWAIPSVEQMTEWLDVIEQAVNRAGTALIEYPPNFDVELLQFPPLRLIDKQTLER